MDYLINYWYVVVIGALVFIIGSLAGHAEWGAITGIGIVVLHLAIRSQDA